MKALVVGTPFAIKNHFSGAFKRVGDISEFLESLNFDVEIDDKIPNNERFDLICLVSYATAIQLKRARKQTRLLWFDATDSWSLTRQSLGYWKSPAGWARITRDIFFTRRARKADFVTFCSRRDASKHYSSLQKTFVYTHSQPEWRELNDFGARLVFVGPYKYSPNKNAFVWLTDFYQKHREFSVPLYVYGAGYPDSDDIRINIIANAPDAEIYGCQDIHVVPIESGAGVKYKALTPISLGIHTIATHEGANGLKRDLPNLGIASNMIQFEELLINHGTESSPKQIRVSNRILEDDDSQTIRDMCVSLNAG